MNWGAGQASFMLKIEVFPLKCTVFGSKNTLVSPNIELALLPQTSRRFWPFSGQFFLVKFNI